MRALSIYIMWYLNQWLLRFLSEWRIKYIPCRRLCHNYLGEMSIKFHLNRPSTLIRSQLEERKSEEFKLYWEGMEVKNHESVTIVVPDTKGIPSMYLLGAL